MSKTNRRLPARKKTAKVIRVKKAAFHKNLKSKKIKTEEAYELTLTMIDGLMKKGENNLNPKELGLLRSLAEAVETYEDTQDPLPLPNSLTEIVRMRMFSLRLSQSYAAKLLGVSDTKFSMIMNGKQKPDIYFLKAVHDKLKVNAELILQAI